MKKPHFMFIILILSCICLTVLGCSKQPQPPISIEQPLTATDMPTSSPNTEEASVAENIEHRLEQISHNIIIDIDVPATTSDEVQTLAVDTLAIDFQQACDVLLEDAQIAEHIKDEPLEMITTTNNEVLQLIDGALIFDTVFSTYITNVFSLDSFSNADLFATNQEFDFASREEAINIIKSTLSMIGITNTGSCLVYSLDYETMDSEEKRLFRANPERQDEISNGDIPIKSSWTSSDNCYYIVMELLIEGIPIIQEDRAASSANTIMMGNSISAIYSEKGIMYLSFQPIYVPQNDSVQYDECIACDDALDVVIQKFSSLITNAQYRITDIELVYAPQQRHNRIKLVPAWRITIIETAPNRPQHALVMLVNAIDGYEIV